MSRLSDSYSENDSYIVDDDAPIIYDSDVHESESYDDNVERPKIFRKSKKRLIRRSDNMNQMDGSDSSDESERVVRPIRNKRKFEDPIFVEDFTTESSQSDDLEIVQPKKKKAKENVVEKTILLKNSSTVIEIQNEGDLPEWMQKTIFKRTCQLCNTSTARSIHCNPNLDWQFCGPCILDKKESREIIFKYGGMIKRPPSKCVKFGGCLICAEFKKFQQKKN